MGGITEIATSAPGYNSMRPNTCAPLAEILKLNGYSTAQFGKCHEVPVWQTSPMGPFDNWPTGSGFEYFYGFIGGEAHQYYPALYEGTTPVEPDRTPEEGYHLMGDMTDKAINWVHQQKSLMPDKPFFAYFAPGATHAPHHVPKEWADKYAGQFDEGWDALRERTFARQQELGVIPPDAKLTPRHEEIPAWDDMPEALKPVLRRQMEVYAGFMEFTDHHVGRLFDALEDLGVLDDTLVYYIVGDNGASAEGTMNGTFNEMINFNGAAALETPEFMLERLDDFGGPDSYNHYAVGWAHAMDTPYQWTKQVASHFGGTRNGAIVHWPDGFDAKDEIRTQFTHVIDIAPTVLDAAGLAEPTFVNGVQQKPIEGVSMRYAFDDAGAAERHETQYFEMFGNRGIYHKGWTAVTRHKTPVAARRRGDARVRRRRVGALRHGRRLDAVRGRLRASTPAGSTSCSACSSSRPRGTTCCRSTIAPRSGSARGRRPAGRSSRATGSGCSAAWAASRRTRWSASRTSSHAVTAEIVVPDGGAQGVIIAQGGSIGGWSLYAKDGRLRYCYNLLGVQRFYVGTERRDRGGHAPGADGVRLRRAGLGKGGTVTPVPRRRAGRRGRGRRRRRR